MSNLVQRKTAKVENSTQTQASSLSSSKPDRSAKFKEPPISLKDHKVFVRMTIAAAIFIIVYFTNRHKDKVSTLAGLKEFVALREHKIPCNPDSFSPSEIELYPKCIPAFCKRFVTDNLISEHEIAQLQQLSANIFDPNDESSKNYCLHSHSAGIESLHDTIKSIQPKIIENIAQRFEIAHNSLYLTAPTCFAKITNVTNEHSELMQSYRFDKNAHKHVQFSVYIFLARYKTDYQGGRFIITDEEGTKRTNVIVDPKVGRVLVYSSGSENTHFIESVISGHLSLLTLSFTCDKESVLSLK